MRHTRFVILSYARSGSSLLTETLHQHPQIYCHGEIFHEDAEWHIREECRHSIDLSQRSLRPIDYCYSVLAFTNGRQAAGFKMWRNQAPDACLALLGDPNVLKIILERDNRLAQLSSFLLAEQTAIWNVPAGPQQWEAPPPPQQVPFKRKQFLNYIKNVEETFAFYNENARGRRLHLRFRRLNFASVFEFLGVSQIQTTPATQKLYSDDILARFTPESRPAVISLLAEIGRPEWAREG